MRWNVIWNLARAESRLVRRLVRFWVFAALAFLLCLVSYIYYAFIHAGFSAYSPSVGAASPRYLIAAFGTWPTLLFVIGLVFLAFDVRARDERERVSEVLDSRPASNLEMLSGRFLGLFVRILWAMVATVAVIQLVGWLGSTLRWPFGEPVKAESLFHIVVVMGIPAFVFTLGLVFFLALAFKNRLATAFGALVVVGGTVVLVFLLPFDYLPIADLTGAYTLDFPSDLTSSDLSALVLWQRSALLAAGLGLLILAAAIHPRPDDSRRSHLALAGAAFLVVAAACLGIIWSQAAGVRGRLDAWAEAHQARRDATPPDVEALRGVVRIEPGRRIELELELDVQAPPGGVLERALFTLNPGLEVRQVTDASGRELDFAHTDGLLEIELVEPLADGPESRVTLEILAGGRPDIQFAYLDSTLRLGDLKALAGNIALLGYDAAVFDGEFVALLPGLRWLPTAGTDFGRQDDFYELELEVELPAGWLAAGPGRRRPPAGAEAPEGRVRYRFAPPAPIPGAALVASRFTSHKAEAAGVELELLVHPRHVRNLEVFAGAGGEIVGWIEERLQEAAELGLPYPYDALTLVEVPTTLRGYTGGWRLDTALAPPAMLLLRESSFPTARFDRRFRDPDRFAEREGGLPRAQRDALLTYFESDFNGGNLFLGAARNFFLHQTSARGEGALALDFVCHALANRVITGQQGYFSAHIFGPEFGAVIAQVIPVYLNQRDDGVSLAEAVHQIVVDRPAVWDAVLGVALAEMDPWEDPKRAVDVLALKGNALARWIVDGLGRERTGALLAALRQRTAGRTFRVEDLEAVADELGIDFEKVAGDWLHSTELPGFVASEARLDRLPDSADGAARYQLAFHLRNDEPAPGLVRLRWKSADAAERGGREPPWEESEPIRVAARSAVEIGQVLSRPPEKVWVVPYLAWNRSRFEVPLPVLDDEKTLDAEPFTGARASDWSGTVSEAIVVDDLDAGFRVEADAEGSGLRFAERFSPQELDQGLPAWAGFPSRRWTRRDETAAWGKYRHTYAVIRAGDGEKRAVFEAVLPRSGSWRLELHLPPGPSSRRGDYHLEVVDRHGDRQELTFDASAAAAGWNELGVLEMSEGEARVVLSDRTDGRTVVADAVRWQPLGQAKGEAKEKEVTPAD